MKKKTMLLIVAILVVLCAVPVAASAPRNGRYSTALMRMQWQDDRGRWHTYEGVQWVPDYVDLQP